MASRLASRNGGRLGLAVLAVVLLGGLGLRLDYAWEGRAPVFDAVAYGRIAADLERERGFTLGQGATQAVSDYSPALPLLAAGLYRLSGGVHERLTRLVLALLGSLSVLFAYLIGRRLAGPAAGLIGAAAVAVYPALLEYQGMLMGEPLAAALLSGAILATLWANDLEPSRLARGSCRRGGRPPGASLCSGRRDVIEKEDEALPSADYAQAEGTPPRRLPRERWLIAGLLFGALTLVRPEYLAVAFVLATAVFARSAGAEWRSSLARAGILLAGVAIAVAPWTIRNAIALDRFVPISTGGGQVLFAGSYMPSGGDPEQVGREVLERHPGLLHGLASRYVPQASPPTLAAVLARVRLEQILAALAAQRYPGMGTDTALSRMGRERLWRDVSEQPLEYAGFVAAKVARIWWHGPRDVMRQPPWEALHWALLALGLLGLALLARRRRWEALLFAAVFVSITAISALLVASPRRVLVMLPLIAALAGVGATWLWGGLHRRPGGRLTSL